MCSGLLGTGCNEKGLFSQRPCRTVGIWLRLFCMKPSAEIRKWPDPRKGPLLVRVWYGTAEGRPAVVGVEVWGTEPLQNPWPLDRRGHKEARRVTAANVRLPLGRWLDQWVEMGRARARASRKLYGGTPGHEETVQRFESELNVKRRGRKPLSDDFLRQVAVVYVKEIRAGNRRPAKAVKEQLGPTSDSNARTWIRQARLRMPELFEIEGGDQTK